jgi:hypothetical protein
MSTYGDATRSHGSARLTRKTRAAKLEPSKTEKASQTEHVGKGQRASGSTQPLVSRPGNVPLPPRGRQLAGLDRVIRPLKRMVCDPFKLNSVQLNIFGHKAALEGLLRG